MASFTFNEQGIYALSGDTATFDGDVGGTSTITDNEADGTFEVGDPIFINGTNVGTFVGTLMVNGIECPVVERGSQQFVLSPDPIPSADWPRSYDTSVTGDLDMTDFPVCFAAGTMIATPDGECAVEALAIGDDILTADGKTVPVKWIGRQTVHKAFTPRERFVPVRVKAGALGLGLPHRDLVLTADHALAMDGLLINASALVNDDSIVWEPIEALPERVTYYHIETERHDVILANGAAAETFVDHVTRRRFDNFAEYDALYGDEATVEALDTPRVSAARLLPMSVRHRSGGRAAA